MRRILSVALALVLSMQPSHADGVDVSAVLDGVTVTQNAFGKITAVRQPSIMDLGADPTGAADSTAAFNAAANTNHEYWVPPGTYTIGGCLALDMMGLRGPGIYQRQPAGDVSLSSGAVLAFQPATKSCPAQIVTTRGGVAFEGLTFYWPEQNASQTPTYAGVAYASAAGSKIIALAAGNAAPPIGALVVHPNIPPMSSVVSVFGSFGTGFTVTISLASTGAGVTAGQAVGFWSPVAYPPLLANASYHTLTDVTFRNNAVINAYEFMQVSPTSQGAGDWRVTENRIYSVYRDIDFQALLGDTVHIADNLFTDGIYGGVALTGTGYLSRWSQVNSEFVHVDTGGPTVEGLTITGNLVHGHRYGERVLSGLLGLTTTTGTTFDGVGTLLSVENTGGFVGELFGGDHTLGTFDPVTTQYQPGLSMPGIVFNTSGTVRASLVGLHIGYAASDAVQVLGTGRALVTVTNGKIENWGLDNAVDDWGVRVGNANATVRISTAFVGTAGNQDGVLINGVKNGALTGSTFDGMKTAVLASSGGTLVITGNSATGSTVVDYQAVPAAFTKLQPGVGTNSWN